MKLPKILCLHGEGTSSEILSIQTGTLAASVPQFTFHYLNAPFPSPPGPGVLPFFEGPYYTWVRASSPAPKSDIAIVRTLLQKTLAEHAFVGVLAFSQGGRVAAGLLRDEVLGKGLRFGVFLSCTYPPLCLQPDCGVCYSSALGIGIGGEEGMGEGEERRQEVARDGHGGGGKAVIRVPSLHVHGSRDPFLRFNRLLLGRCFDGDRAWLVETQEGHRVPGDRGTVEVIRSAVLCMWDEIERELN